MNHREYAKKHKIDTTKQNIPFELSHLITEARLYAGITQAELAELTGTQQPSISRAEAGDLEPSVSFLAKVAEAIGSELVLPRFNFGTNTTYITSNGG